MDYSDKISTCMCKAWIHFAKLHNPQATITIFHTKNIHEIRSFAKRFRNIFFRRMTISKRIKKVTGGFLHRPVQDLQLSLWEEINKIRLTKFIYIDADALVLGSLKNWWDVADEMPYIGIPERALPGGSVLLNAGIFSYSSKSEFVTVNTASAPAARLVASVVIAPQIALIVTPVDLFVACVTAAPAPVA